jgi:hypothetical protein
MCVQTYYIEERDRLRDREHNSLVGTNARKQETKNTNFRVGTQGKNRNSHSPLLTLDSRKRTK